MSKNSLGTDMSDYHFFERMEHEINWTHEYEKIEEIVCNEKVHGYETINSWISKNFRQWKKRENYSTFSELRKYLGFEIGLRHPGYFEGVNHSVSMTDFFLYSEMLINVSFGLIVSNNDIRENEISEKLSQVVHIIRFDIDKAGFELKEIGGDWLILQKNAAASVVAEYVEPSLADAIMEFNHYALKGNIKRKKELLKTIADGLEPHRKELKALNCKEENVFFDLVNNCNIRHNNFDPLDKTNYREKLSKAGNDCMEKIYDFIYEEGLLCFLSLSEKERNKKAEAVRSLY